MKKFLGMTFLLGIVAGAYWSLKMSSADQRINPSPAPRREREGPIARAMGG